MIKLKDFFHRVYHFEYWPFWAFYTPVFILWPVFSLRGKSLLFFTAANPCIPHGGCFGESKIEILKKIPENYLPKTFFADKTIVEDEFTKWFSEGELTFPLVAKPDVGERGDNIRILHSFSEIQTYQRSLERPFLLQEFLTSPFELGVMVTRDPHTDKVEVTSIVSKIYMHISGNGRSTIKELICASPRYRFQWERIKNEVQADKILNAGEKLMLEPIGNHKRGTIFINSNDLITPEVQRIFTEIVTKIDGFYIGRFDLKAPDKESLEKGRGLKVMELNGAFSEPGHIYDPEARLLDAWSDLIKNWWTLAGISSANLKRGHSMTRFKDFKRLYGDYKKLRQIGAHEQA